MSSSSDCRPANGFSAGKAPTKLHHLGRAFGLLSSIQQAEECQIARIDDNLVVLPLNLDLSQYLGQSIGMMRDLNRILIRRLNLIRLLLRAARMNLKGSRKCATKP
ncbi:MAG: hypothetical protein WCW68_00430 [Methanothrix sp.]